MEGMSHCEQAAAACLRSNNNSHVNKTLHRKHLNVAFLFSNESWNVCNGLWRGAAWIQIISSGKSHFLSDRTRARFLIKMDFSIISVQQTNHSPAPWSISVTWLAASTDGTPTPILCLFGEVYGQQTPFSLLHLLALPAMNGHNGTSGRPSSGMFTNLIFKHWDFCGVSFGLDHFHSMIFSLLKFIGSKGRAHFALWLGQHSLLLLTLYHVRRRPVSVRSDCHSVWLNSYWCLGCRVCVYLSVCVLYSVTHQVCPLQWAPPYIGD